jgi:hypothetical protein
MAIRELHHTALHRFARVALPRFASTELHSRQKKVGYLRLAADLV